MVDTNAARVLARAVAGRRLGAAEAQSVADSTVPPGRGWEWNQAVLDLGATVCAARRPACDRCPVAPHCRWRRAGGPAPDPAAGSAGSSRRQPVFAGSDRQGRGRLVGAMLRGPVPAGEVAEAAGWPTDPLRAERVAARLVADGLAVTGPDGGLRLP